MKKALSLLVLSVLFFTGARAQYLESVVKDAQTKAVLPYVNIGILGKAIGTCSDLQGKFALSLIVPNDSVRISMVGYKPQTFAVADVGKNEARYKTILLEPMVVQLKEVKVQQKDLTEVVLGNTSTSQSTTAGFTSNKLGNEIGVLIKIKKSPTLIKKFNASIAGVIRDSIVLRLNFYNLKNGLPDQIINTQSIFVNLKRGDKQISVDLLPYNVIVTDKFFVSLEWIRNSRGHGIMFSGSLLSSFMSRETSQAGWEKVGLAGVGFNVLAEY